MFARSVTVTDGINTSGDVEDTWSDNGVHYVVTEEDFRSFDIRFTFEGVQSSGTDYDVFLNGYYNGHASHNVKAYSWNYTLGAWEALTADAQDFPSAGADTNYTFSLVNNDHLDGGEVKFRIYHTSVGVAGHTMNVDLLRLQ